MILEHQNLSVISDFIDSRWIKWGAGGEGGEGGVGAADPIHIEDNLVCLTIAFL